MITPDYSGIFLEPNEIDYQRIDSPLRTLVRLINSSLWARSYGCCAGPAHHGDDPDAEHRFFIGLFIDGDNGGFSHLQCWLDEANRLNGSIGLRADAERVERHPFGHGSVDGWHAFRVGALEIRGRRLPPRTQTYARLIRCLESAWKEPRLPVTGSPDGIEKSPRLSG